MAERGAVDLDRLVKASVTRIEVPMSDRDTPDDPSRFLGSGFFVAPAWRLPVATPFRACWRALTQGTVGSGWRSATSEPTVWWSGPVQEPTSGGGLWELPDLAVIRLTRGG